MSRGRGSGPAPGAVRAGLPRSLAVAAPAALAEEGQPRKERERPAKAEQRKQCRPFEVAGQIVAVSEEGFTLKAMRAARKATAARSWRSPSTSGRAS